MRLIIFIRDIFKKFPLLTATSTFLLLVANMLDACSIFSLIVIIDLFINPDFAKVSFITKQIVAFVKNIGLPPTLSLLLVIFFLFNILKICFQIFAQYFVLKTKYAMLRDIMMGTFKNFFNARWYFFSSNKQGTLVNTFIREMSVVGDAFGAMARYFAGILQIILYLVLPFYLSWQVASITIASAILLALPFSLLGKISYALGKLNISTANQIGAIIQESFNLAKIILGFGNQHKSVSGLDSAFSIHRKATIKSQLLTFSMPLIYFPFGLLVLIIGLVVARSFTLPLSETAVLFYSLSRVIPIISNLTGEKSYIDNFFPSYEQILNLRHGAAELKQSTGIKIFSGLDREISIENLSFGYFGQEAILLNINMRIVKGKMVAIVGNSGAGKSTLIDMIMGFNEPSSGQILFDGIPIRDFDINSYRNRIGYVPQDSVLFNISIRDNLLWARDDATEKEMKEACKKANADDFIKSFSHSYDTIVGDRGVRLSGGQIQRIALARAILRRPALLVLDEATSALDTYSERLIQQAIDVIAKQTTVIVVAHRLSTIINADYIYVLKNGHIVEEGTYYDLIQRNGYFNKMIQLQTLEVPR